MKEPGLDGRHRNRDGKISEKHGNTLNRNLPTPIAQFPGGKTLAQMRQATGETSESKVRAAAARMRKK